MYVGRSILVERYVCSTSTRPIMCRYVDESCQKGYCSSNVGYDIKDGFLIELVGATFNMR
jgi:hypothetical protein